MTRWSDKNLRGNKRELSLYEKRTCFIPGRALVMAGEPPLSETSGGEVEELVEVGFDPRDIVIVEREPDLAERLYNHYGDISPVHYGTVEDFLQIAQSRYSYLHLDFCGYLSVEMVESLQTGWRRAIAPAARLRLSVGRSRKPPPQRAFEENLRDSVIYPFINALGNATGMRDDYEEGLSQLTDATQLVGFLWLLNFFFGMTGWEYADRRFSGADGLPPVNGTHLITNLRRFTYHEAGRSMVMDTIWTDLIPLDGGAIPVDDRWAPAYVDQVLLALLSPIPTFNNPDLYKE